MEQAINPFQPMRVDYDISKGDMKAAFEFAKQQRWSLGKLRFVARAVELTLARIPANGELDLSQITIETP